MSQQIPFIIYAESTPNPATMKFVANKYLVPKDVTYESVDIDNNPLSPLAQSLLNFPFVKKVYIATNFVSLTREEVVEWEDVVHQVREFITEFLNNGGIAYKGGAEEELPQGDDTSYTAVAAHREAKSEVEKNIIAILDEYVKPAVENDGGAILFDSYNEGKVNLILKGSCSGCPSSVMTLKSGVENLLREMMPEDVQEVVAVNG
ncbi:MAG: NifU family protein [Vicingaceae bacterium]